MAQTFNPFGEFDFTKLAADFKMPTFDMDALIAVNQKNIEALTVANKLAAESAQAFAKRQSEIVRQSVEETTKNVQTMFEAGSAQDKAVQQADLVKSSFGKAVSDYKELTDLVAKAQAETFDVLNTRVNESLEEVKDFAKTA